MKNTCLVLLIFTLFAQLTAGNFVIKRGVNVSHWLSQTKIRGEEREKYVTEKAYQNPMFVEDIVREIAVKLNDDPNITWFAVESENFESIHNHNAYAYIERSKSAVEKPSD